MLPPPSKIRGKKTELEKLQVQGMSDFRKPLLSVTGDAGCTTCLVVSVTGWPSPGEAYLDPQLLRLVVHKMVSYLRHE